MSANYEDTIKIKTACNTYEIDFYVEFTINCCDEVVIEKYHIYNFKGIENHHNLSLIKYEIDTYLNIEKQHEVFQAYYDDSKSMCIDRIIN